MALYELIMVENVFDTSFLSAEFTEGFRRQAKQMGLLKLQDVLSLSPAELINKPFFTYHWLSELCAFLVKHESLEVLQPILENTNG
jgi:hypothetical protein